MATPDRFLILGDYKVVAKVRVLNQHTNEEFDGELRFKATSTGVETTDKENVKVNFDLVRDENDTMWELVVFNEVETK